MSILQGIFERNIEALAADRELYARENGKIKVMLETEYFPIFEKTLKDLMDSNEVTAGPEHNMLLQVGRREGIKSVLSVIENLKERVRRGREI